MSEARFRLGAAAAALRQRIRRADAGTFTALAALFTLVAMSWLFLALADEVLEGETHRIDSAVLTALRDASDPRVPIGPAWLLLAARDITALGGHTVLTLFTLLATGYCLLLRDGSAARLILAAAAGGALLSSGLKWGLGRARPDIVPHLVEVSSLSFPSGHAMLSAAIYLSVGAVAAQVTPFHRTRLYLLGAALLVTGLVGLSRVYLGVHYPTDVLAGWAAGLAWAMLCWLATLALRRANGGTAA